MKIPKINFCLHGRADKNGAQVLKIRYSFRYQTHYIHTSIRLKPADWDRVNQRVIVSKGRSLVHNTTASNLNAWLESQKTLFFKFLTDAITSSKNTHFDFDQFRSLFEPEPEYLFWETANNLLLQDEKAALISKSTATTYRAALKRFIALVGEDIHVADISADKITTFFNHLEKSGNNNLANQYTTFLRVIYRRVLKEYSLTYPDPFAGLSLEIVRISTKKTLSISEYQSIYATFLKAANNSLEKIILRRFLIMCRGMRWSDTIRLNTQHFNPVGEKGYFTLKSQKTKGTYICPLTARDVIHLLIWQENGLLFPPMSRTVYREHLKRISKKIIGRPLTTHYGRHFAGDFIVNSEGMEGISDVKKVLGISSDQVAEIYAKRELTTLLDKFFAAMEKIEQ